MQFSEEPEGYLITWTVYGTFLQGDVRWWRKRDSGQHPPQPLLEQWRRDRLKHPVVLLNKRHRRAVEDNIAAHCNHRGWSLWTANARSNHVHVVVTAAGYIGVTVRDQLKANATIALRKLDSRFLDRPIWTTKGDVQILKSEKGLEHAIVYVNVAQDRMDRGKF